MIQLGLLSVSDERRSVHDDLSPYITACEEKIASALEATGEVHVVRGAVINSPATARAEAAALARAGVTGVIFNVPIFSFPNLVLIAASLSRGPFLTVCQANPAYPGLVGLLAVTGMLNQMGIPCNRLWGDMASDEMVRSMLAFARSAHAVNTLRGQVFGLIGGRSIGMGTGAVDPGLWFQTFGVDVQHVDQLELLRCAPLVPDADVERAIGWLEINLGRINYDGDKLTPQTLREQVRWTCALKGLATERQLDFVGVKCHYELSAHYTTQCLGAAFLNDPYDWDGAKEPLVFSCEADGDAALTMQLLKLVSGRPSLFMDLRYYDKQENLFTFCNCGAMASWYAARSADPRENLRRTALSPIIPKYKGMGAHVHYVAKAGPLTCARLVRTGSAYRMQVFRADVVERPVEKTQETCAVWPHAYLRVQGSPEGLIAKYGSNHVHAVDGDYMPELERVCQHLAIGFEPVAG
jgi:L-fucose isomerase